MSIYREWAFVESPFGASSLQADEKGCRLLVGRSAELRKIKIYLSQLDKWTCIDGAIGIGKTSLVNVATYELYSKFISEECGLLLIPCIKSFDLKDVTDVSVFKKEVLLAVAQTLLAKMSELSFHSRYFNFEGKNQLDQWLNNPSFESKGGGLGPISVSVGSSPNDSAGFNASGLEIMVSKWLKELFQRKEDGAVVCIVDNMELLATSSLARAAVERMRDDVFTMHGIKWVMCGANGIVPAIASPRINAFLQDMIEVKSLQIEDSKKVLESRIEFCKNSNDYYLPFTSENFETLYKILNNNLRELLGHIDKYCMWVYSEDYKPVTENEKNALFDEWLMKVSSDTAELVRKHSTNKIWDVLVKAIEIGGIFSSEDMQVLGVSNAANFSQYMSVLSESGLVSISINEEDKRRKTMVVTPKGCLAVYRSRLAVEN